MVFQPLAGIAAGWMKRMLWRLKGKGKPGRFACWRFGRLAFHRGDSILTCPARIGSGASITRDEFANWRDAVIF